MPKTLCKSKKSRKSGKATLDLVPHATHMCRKCGRVAKSKKKLCKPSKI